MKKGKLTRSDAGKLGGAASRQSSYDRRKNNVLKYDSSPKFCKNCSQKIEYDKRYNDFCSQRCGATFNNLARSQSKQCLNCKIDFKSYNRNQKCCSRKCYHAREWIETKQNIKNNKGTYHYSLYKRFLIECCGEKCFWCGWAEYHTKTRRVPIQLHHKDGIASNNNIENLVLICPNCHSLTDNYAGLNKGHGRPERRERYKPVGS